MSGKKLDTHTCWRRFHTTSSGRVTRRVGSPYIACRSTTRGGSPAAPRSVVTNASGSGDATPAKATVILSLSDKLSGGSALTLSYARQANKPVLYIHNSETGRDPLPQQVRQLKDFIE